MWLPAWFQDQIWKTILAVSYSNTLKTLQSEIADMIWEVDEDCDQAVNWSEFQAMYHRCNHDQAGKRTQLSDYIMQAMCLSNE